MKKLGVVVLALVVLLGIGVYAYSSVPNPGHGADEIFIYINGNGMSLQSAIDAGKFSGNTYTGEYPNTGNIVFGHNDVYVNVGTVSKDLQTAIGDNSLCRFDGGNYGGYTGGGVAGNTGDEIIVTIGGSEMTLQAAINSGLLAAKWNVSINDVCSGQSFVRTRCGISEVAYGTKCCDSSWSPATTNYCNDVAFTQTSDCGNTRTAYGTANCADYYSGASIVWANNGLCPSSWDTCDGGNGGYQYYYCSSTDSKECWDYWNQWDDGDWNCWRRYIDCN